MTWAAALFVVAASLVLAKWFRVPMLAAEVLGRCRSALRDLKDPALEDHEKERAIQAHARRLLLLFFGVTLASCAAVMLPVGVLALLDAAGIIELDAVLQQATSVKFACIATLLSIAMVMMLRARRP